MASKGALFAVLAVFAAATTVHADGTVTRAKGCGDRIFASTTHGSSELVGTGEGAVADGDELTGELETIGHVVLYDKTAGHNVVAIIEAYGLDKAQVTQRMQLNCRSLVANTFTSGQVLRTNGCGNKIFVDTVKGFAVLERIAGGLVFEGDTLTGDFNRAGRATVQDKQTGGILTVFVDDFQLAKSAIQRKIQASCR